MTETQSAAPGEAEGPVVGQIETDMFCSACGYNLHSQKVLRDTRLGIPVTRCPECGAWQAAGHATSAGQVWLKRAGVLLVVLWALLLLGMMSINSLGLMITNMALPEVFSRYGEISSGRWGRVPFWPHDMDDLVSVLPGVVISLFFASGFSVLSGVIVSVLFCHCRRYLAWLSLLIPTLSTCAAIIFTSHQMIALDWAWHFYRIDGPLVAIETVILALGLFLGRPLVRFFLQALLPQHLLQYIRILWTCDGRTPPWQKSES